jgi:hypothetical protein
MSAGKNKTQKKSASSSKEQKKSSSSAKNKGKSSSSAKNKGKSSSSAKNKGKSSSSANKGKSTSSSKKGKQEFETQQKDASLCLKLFKQFSISKEVDSPKKLISKLRMTTTYKSLYDNIQQKKEGSIDNFLKEMGIDLQPANRSNKSYMKLIYNILETGAWHTCMDKSMNYKSKMRGGSTPFYKRDQSFMVILIICGVLYGLWNLGANVEQFFVDSIGYSAEQEVVTYANFIKNIGMKLYYDAYQQSPATPSSETPDMVLIHKFNDWTLCLMTGTYLTIGYLMLKTLDILRLVYKVQEEHKLEALTDTAHFVCMDIGRFMINPYTLSITGYVVSNAVQTQRMYSLTSLLTPMIGNVILPASMRQGFNDFLSRRSISTSSWGRFVELSERDNSRGRPAVADRSGPVGPALLTITGAYERNGSYYPNDATQPSNSLVPYQGNPVSTATDTLSNITNQNVQNEIDSWFQENPFDDAEVQQNPFDENPFDRF